MYLNTRHVHKGVVESIVTIQCKLNIFRFPLGSLIFSVFLHCAVKETSLVAALQEFLVNQFCSDLNI